MIDLSEQGLGRLEAAFGANLQWVLKEKAENRRIPALILDGMESRLALRQARTSEERAWTGVGAANSAADQETARADKAEDDLQEARQWIQALRDEVRVSGGWAATAQKTVIEGANAFLSRTAPREGRE